MKQLLQFQADDPPPRRSQSRQAPGLSQKKQEQVLQQKRQPLHRPLPLQDDKYSYLTMQPQSQLLAASNPNMVQAHHQTMPQDWAAAPLAPPQMNNLQQVHQQMPFEMQSVASAFDVISDQNPDYQTYGVATQHPQMQYPQQQTPNQELQQFQQSPQQQFQQQQFAQQAPIYLVPASQLPSMNSQSPTPFLVLEPRMQQQQMVQDVVNQVPHEQMLHNGHQGTHLVQQQHYNPLDAQQAQPLVPQHAPQHVEHKRYHSNSMENRRQAANHGSRNPITGQSANDYNYKSGSDISNVLYSIDDQIKRLFSKADKGEVGDPLNASFDRHCQHVLTDMIAEHPEIPPKMLRSHWYGQILDHQMKKKNNSGSPVRDKIMKSQSDVNLPFKRQLPQNWSSQANPLLGGDGTDHRRVGRRYSPDLHVFKSHHSRSNRSSRDSYSSPKIGENLKPKDNGGDRNDVGQVVVKESFFNKFTDNDKVVANRNAALESYRRGLDRQMEEKRIRDGKNKKETSPERVPYPQEAPTPQSQQQTKRRDSKAVRGQPRSKDISQLRHQFTFRDHDEDKRKDLAQKEDGGQQEMVDPDFERMESGHSQQSAANQQRQQPPSLHQLNQSANALIQMMQNVVTETVASTQFQHFQIQQLLQAEVGRYPGLDQTAVPLQIQNPKTP